MPPTMSMVPMPISHSLRQRREADILIFDAQYTPDEYSTYRGWGHSTWLEATRIAREANVRRLVLFHHDPDHTDENLDRIVDEARGHFAETVAAREQSSFSVG